jgi:FtsZ-binding cell division protein ZapB
MKKSSEFRVQGSGFRRQGAGSRVSGSGFRVPGFGFRIPGSACLLTAVLWSLTSGAGAAEAGNGVDGVRASLEKWVDTRKVISQEKRDWDLGQEMLNERISMLEREIETLRARIAEAQESITDADQKRAGLLEENEALKAASSGLAESMAVFEIRTRSLLNRMPDPIRERVKPLSQRIPVEVGETKLSFAERFQNVVGILNEVNKFNREITVTSEVRALPDGTSAEVAAMYVGVSRAYYVGGNGTIAGYGTAGADGWVWTAADEIAPQVARCIAILKNEQVASFVQLPVEVQ